MLLYHLITTLTIPIEIELHDVNAKYLFAVPSTNCKGFYNYTVIRWWPESREKIVVFLDYEIL
jgi:hypothetical protein